MPDTPPGPRVGPPPICACGHDRYHSDVHPERHYGFWSWVLLLNGASATPKRIDFICQRCKRIVETSTDRSIMLRFRN